MSLLSDPEYLIHNLRLAYLRHVDDPYGPRILSLNPGYTSNAHIIASGLADQELWPEIAMPSTPILVEQEPNKGSNKQHSGFPGATGLKYSQTIIGQNRIGAMGMRVNGKRGSLIREPALVVGEPETLGKRHRSDSEPTPASTVPGDQLLDPEPEKPATSILLRRRSADVTELEGVPAPEDLVKIEPFKPPFARAAEMEERRQIRMRSRFAAIRDPPKPLPTLDLESPNPEVSEDEISGEEDSDMLGHDTPLEGEEIGDEFFDPEENEFGPRIVLASSASDGMLSASNSALSTSHSSGGGAYGNSSHLDVRPISRPRLSPVHEVHPNQHQEPLATGSSITSPPPQGSVQTNVTPQRTYKSEGSYFELVVPPMASRTSQMNNGLNSNTSQGLTRDPTVTSPTAVPEAPSNIPVASTSSHSRQPSTLTFERIAVPPLPSRPAPSALSQILASKASKADNPFSELYSLISSRSNFLSIDVIYPFSSKPMTAVTLKVRSDASVEEVIGFALWTYWEEGLQPKLDDPSVDEAKHKDKLSAAGWSLRITEDGEVDDDFPAMERMAKMSKFNFEGYAILPETPAQAEQNRGAEVKIVRRASRVMNVTKKAPEPAPQSLAPPGPSTGGGSGGSFVSLAPVSSSIGAGSILSQGPQQFLRVKVAEEADAHFSTTISVKESMYMEEVLEKVCGKRKIDNPKEWCLVYEMKIFVPLDKTVASLQGKTELYLVKQENLEKYKIRRPQTRSTDPNASIFTRISEVPEQQYSAALDFTTAYKKYTVYRKMPMLIVRHERTLAMDGDYIRIMPPATRAFLDSMKTSSYHIKTVIACTQSAKSSSNFKLVVWRDGSNKRYDFEAESPKVAAEIVRNIRDLRSKRLERSGTLNRSRRSRHAG
ncbi:SIN1-domain-containing protein [Ramaria rubella]|nr:SIN1-domain-containing protein [Ramaria rubella]